MNNVFQNIKHFSLQVLFSALGASFLTTLPFYDYEDSKVFEARSLLKSINSAGIYVPEASKKVASTSHCFMTM
jgi:hypothetical protein